MSPTQHPAPAVAAKGPSTPAQLERNAAYAAGDAPEPHVFETPPRSPAMAAQPAAKAAQAPQEASVAELKSRFEPVARQVCCLLLYLLPEPLSYLFDPAYAQIISTCLGTSSKLDKAYI